MLSLFRIDYLDNDNTLQVEVVVAETMVEAIECFEHTMDLQVSKCELLTGYNGVLVNVK